MLASEIITKYVIESFRISESWFDESIIRLIIKSAIISTNSSIINAIKNSLVLPTILLSLWLNWKYINFDLESLGVIKFDDEKEWQVESR